MAKKTEEKEIVVPETADKALAKLNATEAEAMYGKMEKEDLVIPRLTVLQGLSPEAVDGIAKPGVLFVTSINRELGKEVEIIPLMRNRSRIRWAPRKEGKGIKCKSADSIKGVGEPGGVCSECPHSQWTGTNTPPTCDLQENVFVAVRKDEDWFPYAFSGSKTKMKPFQAFNTLLMMEQMKGRPIFGKSYTVKVVEEMNKSGERYFNYRIAVANENKPLPDNEIERVRELFNMIRVSNVKIEQEAETTSTNEEL